MIQHLSNGLYVTNPFIFGIKEDIIQINNHENVEFFGQNLINIILETGQGVW